MAEIEKDKWYNGNGNAQKKPIIELDAALHIKGFLLILFCIGVAYTFTYGLPHWIKAQDRIDVKNSPERVVRGEVVMLQVTPGNPGGGGFFNALIVKFDGNKSYYDLPRTSKWIPMIGEPVFVHYRVGKSGRIHLESVLPTGEKRPVAPAPATTSQKDISTSHK